MASLKAPPPDRRYEAAVSERLESMIGLDPRTTLDKLRDAQQQTTGWRKQEAQIMAEAAMYEARYGYPSHWEHERKALLSRLSSHERQRMLSSGEKPTESYLDEYAHGDGEYRRFLEDARKEREKLEELRAELANIRAEIEVCRAVEIYFERHARLNEALIYHSGKELGLT